jgi:hypothetical protein
MFMPEQFWGPSPTASYRSGAPLLPGVDLRRVMPAGHRRGSDYLPSQESTLS